MTVNVVLFHSDPVQVERALQALARSSEPPRQVQIHLNEDDGADLDLPTWCTVSRTQDNLGFAGAHNRLLAAAFDAGAEVVVVHNPDLTLAPDAVTALVAAAANVPCALLGPVLEQASRDGAPTGLTDTLGIRWTRDGRHFDIGQGARLDLPRTDPPRLVAGVSGACLVVPRTAYERIVAASGEFFDEDFIAYREDAELAIRAGVLGVESWLVPAARGLHVRSQRGTTRGRDRFIDLLGVRNRFLILAKWGRRRPGFLPFALFRDVVVVLGVVVRERRSLPGLRQAWQLRGRMREKRVRVLAWSRAHPPPRP